MSKKFIFVGTLLALLGASVFVTGCPTEYVDRWHDPKSESGIDPIVISGTLNSAGESLESVMALAVADGSGPASFRGIVQYGGGITGLLRDGDLIFDLKGSYDFESKAFAMQAASSVVVFSLSGKLKDDDTIDTAATEATVLAKTGDEWSSITLSVTPADIAVAGEPNIPGGQKPAVFPAFARGTWYDQVLGLKYVVAENAITMIDGDDVQAFTVLEIAEATGGSAKALLSGVYKPSTGGSIPWTTNYYISTAFEGTIADAIGETATMKDVAWNKIKESETRASVTLKDAVKAIPQDAKTLFVMPYCANSNVSTTGIHAVDEGYSPVFTGANKTANAKAATALKVISDFTFALTDVPPVFGPPVLNSTDITYDEDGKVTVKYVFDRVVLAPAFEGWEVKGDRTNTITAAKAADSEDKGDKVTLEWAAANALGPADTTTVSTPVIVVKGAFERPTGSAASYTVERYANGAAGLIEDSQTTYYSIPADLGFTENSGLTLRAVLNAIYTPNAPGSTDDVSLDGQATPSSTKTAAAYTEDLSKAVLNLFCVTIGTAASGDKLELKGTTLPATTVTTPNASATNLIVIDIGIPGQDNSSLPAFYIPNAGLGTDEGSPSYGHIRLRVNRGAELVILADNSGYIKDGMGNSAPNGKFSGGCVEVMAGGKLRDGAYEGFPLGSNAVILNRYGSYLSTGPEPESEDATGSAAATYNLYFKGYLLGPWTGGSTADDPKIQWNSGNAAADYLEVRPGMIATTAKLTLKQSIGLFYSVWFVDDAALTIDIGQNESPVFSDENEAAIHGLMAHEANEGTDFSFYGTGETVITIKQGNFLDQRFLSSTASGVASPLAASDGDITIQGNATGDTVQYVDQSTGITGYLITYGTQEGGEESD